MTNELCPMTVKLASDSARYRQSVTYPGKTDLAWKHDREYLVVAIQNINGVLKFLCVNEFSRLGFLEQNEIAFCSFIRVDNNGKRVATPYQELINPTSVVSPETLTKETRVSQDQESVVEPKLEADVLTASTELKSTKNK